MGKVVCVNKQLVILQLLHVLKCMYTVIYDYCYCIDYVPVNTP